jgi:hypothetical protein
MKALRIGIISDMHGLLRAAVLGVKSCRSSFALRPHFKPGKSEEMNCRRGKAKIGCDEVKLANVKAHHRDRPLCRKQNGKRKVVAIVRGNVEAIPSRQSSIRKAKLLHSFALRVMGYLHEHFEVKRINYQEAYGLNGACTNMAKKYFPRLRRAEVGIHHHAAAAFLLRYAPESS